MRRLIPIALFFILAGCPEGGAPVVQSPAALKPGTPLLWVVGGKDPLAALGRGYAFDRAPHNPLNRYVEVDGGHLDVPAAARAVVAAWLAGLPSGE